MLERKRQATAIAGSTRALISATRLLLPVLTFAWSWEGAPCLESAMSFVRNSQKSWQVIADSDPGRGPRDYGPARPDVHARTANDIGTISQRKHMRANSTGRLAILLASLLPLAAQAQVQAIGQQDLVSSTPGLADVNPDVLTFQAGLGLEYHDNIFDLPNGVTPTEATYGGSGRSDTQIRGLFGVNFDKQVSLQRFQLFGQLEPVKFMEFDRFDHVAYDLGANWDWAIGRPWFGTLGVRLTERLSGFDSVQITDKNMEERNKFYATAGMRLTPDWAIVSGIDLETARNSASALDYYDY